MVVEIKLPPVLDPIKAHVRQHKVAYSFGTGVIFAGITFCIMRRTTALGGVGESGALGGPTNTASFSFMFKSPQKINIATVVDREGRGHPGWPIRNIETKAISLSQRSAAKAFDIPEGRLSGHLKGRYPDVDGLHFERVNLIPIG